VLDLNTTVFSEIVNVYLAEHKGQVLPKEIVPQNHFVKTLNEVVAAKMPLRVHCASLVALLTLLYEKRVSLKKGWVVLEKYFDTGGK
jgi:hypothetical protein